MIDPARYGYSLPDLRPLEPPEEDETPCCPICYQETDTLYRNLDHEIVGCDNCLKAIDAWDWQAEQEAEAS